MFKEYNPLLLDGISDVILFSSERFKEEFRGNYSVLINYSHPNRHHGVFLVEKNSEEYKQLKTGAGMNPLLRIYSGLSLNVGVEICIKGIDLNKKKIDLQTLDQFFTQNCNKDLEYKTG